MVKKGLDIKITVKDKLDDKKRFSSFFKQV